MHKLICLHGFGGNKKDWNLIRDQLPNNFEVEAFDLPGHGNSPSCSDLNINSLTELIDHLSHKLQQTKQNFYLCGYSMGGRLASLLYQRIVGQKCKGLILISSGIGIQNIAERKYREKKDLELSHKLEKDPKNFWSNWIQQDLFHSPITIEKKFRQNWLESRMQYSSSKIAEALRLFGASQHSDLRNPLKNTNSLLYIVGELDKKYLAIGRKLQAEIEQLKLEIVSDSGHMVHLEQAAQCAQAIRKFIATQGA